MGSTAEKGVGASGDPPPLPRQTAEPDFHGITGVKVARIEEGAVVYADKDGVEHSLEADTVVMYAGRVPREKEALAFYGSAPEFYMIGDCKKPASVQQLNRHAWSVANHI